MTTHETRLRVRFGETDAMGVANNDLYLQYFEVGRIEHLRAMGHSYAEVHDGGIDMVVVEASIRYLRPLRFDTEVTVETSIEEIGRASFRFAYRLTAGGALRDRLHPPRVRGPADDAADARPGLADRRLSRQHLRPAATACPRA